MAEEKKTVEEVKEKVEIIESVKNKPLDKKKNPIITTFERTEVVAIKDNLKTGFVKGNKYKVHPITAEVLRKRGMVK